LLVIVVAYGCHTSAPVVDAGAAADHEVAGPADQAPDKSAGPDRPAVTVDAAVDAPVGAAADAARDAAPPDLPTNAPADAPRPADARAGVPDGGCSVESPCRGIVCAAPGTRGPSCGVAPLCPPERRCASDDPCKAMGATYICGPATDCQCNGSNVCVRGCENDAGCPEGQTCAADHHCKPRGCQTAAECPVNFLCEAGSCTRKRCTASDTCIGFCVAGGCYTSAGTCPLAVP
jgi:hypothetical protein